MDNHVKQKVAQDLLFPLWQCVDSDFKKKYKADAWGMFENFVKSAACAENLAQFFGKLKQLLPMDWQQRHEESVLAVLSAGDDHLLLDLLRSECAYLVLLTRALNNEKKEAYEAAKNAIA
jgi:hypothetical protein